MQYKGFISYSHAADDRLAPALQSALHRFAKPWYRLRAMRVFRDKTGLSANSALWANIETALSESEWFLLMASPRAAESRWVGQEIDWWFSHRAADRMLILLTDGELAWNETAADFDWERTSALAPALRGKFCGEPLYVDLRWARGRDRLSLRHSQFRDAILDIAAPLLGRAKDELEGEDVRQHRRTRRVVMATAVALLALTAVSVTAAYFAVRQSRIAQSRELAASASVQLSFDPDLSLLLAAEGARVARTTESESALRVALLESHVRGTTHLDSGGLWSAVYSPDGSRIAAAGQNDAVRVWSTTPPAPVTPLHSDLQTLDSIGFSNDGRYLVARGDGRHVRVWEVAAAREVAHFDDHHGLVGRASFSPDSRLLTVAQADDSVVIRDLAQGTAVATLRGHTGRVHSSAFSPDGATVISASADGTARVWDVASGKLLFATPAQGAPLTNAVFSDDGKLAATVCPDRLTVQIWRTGAWKLVSTLSTDYQPVSVVLSPNGERAAVVESLGDRLRLWSTETGEVVTELTGHRGRIFDVGFSGDARRVVTGSEDKTARVWDVRTGALLATLRGHGDIVSHVSFNRDGSRVLSASLDGTVRTWAGFPLESSAESPRPTRSGHDVATGGSKVFSPDGKLFVTLSQDRVAHVWETATENQLAELRGDRDNWASAAFNPASTLVITSGGHNDAAVWDARTGLKLIDLPDSSDGPSAVFDADGKRLVIGEGSLVYDCEECGSLDDLLALASTRATRLLTNDERRIFLHEPSRN